ncbi:MAG: hypothetical protein V3R70_11805 [Syntrophobacteria bacterium]
MVAKKKTQRFDILISPAWRPMLRVLGVKPENAYAEVTGGEMHVRFGRLSHTFSVDAIETASIDDWPVWAGIGPRYAPGTVGPDVDEALFALLEDLVYSQQLAKQGWVKGVGASTRSNPRENLTGDPYFTAGFRAVLMFAHRPHSLQELQALDWDEGPISYRIERLETNRQQDFDEQ